MGCRVLPVLVVAGCFASHAQQGAPCDAVCPAGQVCVDGECWRPDDVPDRDGDGIPDYVDNCPDVANAGQDNEDGDAFGDACDPCPPEANDTPADPDGDGVADG